MTLRFNLLATHLRPEEAHTLIAFLDQLREVLKNTYGDEIATMCQEASHYEFDLPDEGMDADYEDV